MSEIPSAATSPGAQKYSNWALIRRMLGMTWAYKWGCIKVIGLHTALLAMALGGLGFMGLGIDFIREKVNPMAKAPRWPFGLNPPADWSPMAVVLLIAGFVLAAATFRAVLTYFTHVSQMDLVNRQIVVALRSQIYDKMQRLSFRFFDANASGSLINRVTSDVQKVRMFVEMVVVQTLILIITLSVFLVYMLQIHMWLTLACLATTPLLWLTTAVYSRIVRPAYMKNRELVDEVIRRLTENLQGVHVVKGFSLQNGQMETFARANHDVRDQKRWIFWRHSTFIPAVHMLTNINLMVLLGFGGYLVIQYDRAPDVAAAEAVGISIGQLTVFAALLQQFSNQVGNIAGIANSMQESLVGAQRVFEVIDTPMEISSPSKPIRLRKARGKVTFDRVSFAYKNTDPVLRDVNFTAEPGECVAIVGATGSGKSTLLAMIPRFYDPTIGRVFIDDVDARQLDLDDLRRSIGVVFQESFLFSNTVAANIAFGHPDATMEQIEKAAKIACAHDFIMDMDKGYDTVLGEGGSGLSGGQRQRLALARAVLLEPSILLLDDPTAAIDPETEGEILEAMDSAMEGRTTFVVAHRLSTLRRADRVMVLDHGRIVQVGTHAELMQTKGHYRWAAKLQSADRESRQLLGIERPEGMPEEIEK